MRPTSSAGSGLLAAAGPSWVGAAVAQAVLQRGMPGPDTDPAETREWFARNRGRFLAGQVVGGLGFGLFYLPFLGAVVDDVGQDPAARPWAIAALGAGLLSPAAGIAGGMSTTGLASSTMSSRSDLASGRDVAASLRAAGYAFNVSGVLLGLVPAFVTAGRRSRQGAPTWPRLLATLTATSAVAGAAGQLDTRHASRLAAAGPLTWVGIAAWAITESIHLRRHGDRGAVPERG